MDFERFVRELVYASILAKFVWRCCLYYWAMRGVYGFANYYLKVPKMSLLIFCSKY